MRIPSKLRNHRHNFLLGTNTGEMYCAMECPIETKVPYQFVRLVSALHIVMKASVNLREQSHFSFYGLV